MLRLVLFPCVNCGYDTRLHVKGVPICIACLEETDKERKPIGGRIRYTKPEHYTRLKLLLVVRFLPPFSPSLASFLAGPCVGSRLGASYFLFALPSAYLLAGTHAVGSYPFRLAFTIFSAASTNVRTNVFGEGSL